MSNPKAQAEKAERAYRNKALDLLQRLQDHLIPHQARTLNQKMLKAMLDVIREYVRSDSEDRRCKPIQWQFNMPHPKIALIGAGKVSQEDLCACHDQFDTLIELGEPGMRGKAWVAVAKTPVEGIEVQFLETFVPCTWH